jgi:hypothetical protein
MENGPYVKRISRRMVHIRHSLEKIHRMKRNFVVQTRKREKSRKAVHDGEIKSGKRNLLESLKPTFGPRILAPSFALNCMGAI